MQIPVPFMNGSDSCMGRNIYMGTDYSGEYVTARDFQVPTAWIYISGWDFGNMTLDYILICFQRDITNNQ